MPAALVVVWYGQDAGQLQVKPRARPPAGNDWTEQYSFC